MTAWRRQMEWLEKSKKPSKERISGKHAREFRMLANVGEV
jgi:hypothetical protein